MRLPFPGDNSTWRTSRDFRVIWTWLAFPRNSSLISLMKRETWEHHIGVTRPRNWKTFRMSSSSRESLNCEGEDKSCWNDETESRRCCSEIDISLLENATTREHVLELQFSTTVLETSVASLSSWSHCSQLLARLSSHVLVLASLCELTSTDTTLSREESPAEYETSRQ